jgi:hypothetical protein
MAGETGVTFDPVTTFYSTAISAAFNPGKTGSDKFVDRINTSTDLPGLINEAARLRIKAETAPDTGKARLYPSGAPRLRAAAAFIEKRIAILRASNITGTPPPPPPPPQPPQPPTKGPTTRPEPDLTDTGIQQIESRRYQVDKAYRLSREYIRRRLEIGYFQAQRPLPKPQPKPKPRRNPRKRPKPPKRAPRRPPDPPPRRFPDVPVKFPRKLPGPVEIIRKAFEAGRRGIDEVLRRQLEKQRKGPVSRPPGGGRPPAEPQQPRLPESPPLPSPQLEEVTVQAQRQRSPEARQPAPRRLTEPRIEPGPLKIPQPVALPSPSAFPLPALSPLAALAFLPLGSPARTPARAPARPPGQKPAQPPQRGFLEALQSLRAPAEELAEECWTQCRQPGKKKKRKKRRVCISPAKAVKLGLTRLSAR